MIKATADILFEGAPVLGYASYEQLCEHLEEIEAEFADQEFSPFFGEEPGFPAKASEATLEEFLGAPQIAGSPHRVATTAKYGNQYLCFSEPDMEEVTSQAYELGIESKDSLAGLVNLDFVEPLICRNELSVVRAFEPKRSPLAHFVMRSFIDGRYDRLGGLQGLAAEKTV